MRKLYGAFGVLALGAALAGLLCLVFSYSGVNVSPGNVSPQNTSSRVEDVPRGTRGDDNACAVLHAEPSKPAAPDGRVATPTTPQAAEPNAWRLRGRIVLEPGLPVNAASFVQPDGGDLHVFFGREANGHLSVDSGYWQIPANLEFDIALRNDRMPFTPVEGRVPDGIWQLCVDEYSCITLDDVANGDAELEELTGVVVPSINGGVIDFGTVTLGLEALFGRDQVAIGQLFHVSGRPLSWSRELSLVIRTELYAEEEMLVHTDADGRFVCGLYDRLDDSPDKFTHELYCDSEVWDMCAKQCLPEGMETGVVSLNPPRVSGNVLDYGRITVSGALLAITADVREAETLTRADGTPDVSYNGYYNGPSVYFVLDQQWSTSNAMVLPLPHVSTIWTPEGRYHYDAAVVDAPRFYPSVAGNVDCRNGRVTELGLQFAPVGSIPLELTSSRPIPKFLRVIWSAKAGLSEVASDDGWIRPPYRAPVVPGAVTTVTVEAEGFRAARGETRMGDEKLTLHLEHADDGVAARLRVHLPATPEGSEHLELKRHVTVSMPGSDIKPFDRLEDGDTLIFRLPEPGTWRVTLTGALSYGIAGVPAGPIDIYLENGDERDLMLAPVVDSTRMTMPLYINGITCGSEPGFHSGFRLETTEGVWSDRLRPGESFRPSGPPVSILDGKERVPLNRIPSEDGTPDVVSTRLEPRIEVSFSRCGAPEASFYASVVSKDGWSAHWTHDGVAELWLPPGEATVTVQVDMFKVQRPVTVIRGQTARLDVDVDRVRLEITMPRSDGPTDMPAWIVQDASGSLVTTLDSSHTLYLQPGLYRLVAGWGSPPPAVEVDLTDRKDKAVNLPQLPKPKTASLKLTFDTSMLGDDNTTADATAYYAALHREPGDASGATYDTRLMPDGLLVQDLPIGVDLVLICEFRTDSEGLRFLSSPLRLKITGNPKPAAITLHPSVKLHAEWNELNVVTPSYVAGLYLPFRGYPGTHEVVVTDENNELARATVTLKEGVQPARMPQELRARPMEPGALAPGDE